MERTARLRRYQRKDYTQLVDFPVEIVGRDGQVRRYSFDESVRLYQRRVRSASIRYDDLELVQAEVVHCRQRVEQLRRSYLEHFGWGTLREPAGDGAVRGPLLAEVVSFLRRVFPSGEGPPPVDVTRLAASGDEDAYYVRFRPSGRAWILYARPIDPEDPASRAAFRARARRLGAMPPGPDVERLMVAHEGADVGLLLTGTGDWDGPTPPPVGDDDAPDRPDPGVDPWVAGFRALQEGSAGDAVRAFEAGLEKVPASLPLAQAAAVVALLDSQPERAELFARQGLLNHADDPRCRYLLAVALARLGRRDEAAEALGRVRRDAPAAMLGGLLCLADGRLLAAAARVWGAGLPRLDPARWASRALANVRGRVVRLGVGLLGAALLAVAGALGLAADERVAAALLAGSAVGVAAHAWRGAVREAREVLAGRGSSGPRLVSIDFLPRDRHGDAH